jgi:hypothetical protein
LNTIRPQPTGDRYCILHPKVIEPGSRYAEMDSYRDAALRGPRRSPFLVPPILRPGSSDRKGAPSLRTSRATKPSRKLRAGSRRDRDNGRRSVQEGHQVAARIGLTPLIECIIGSVPSSNVDRDAPPGSLMALAELVAGELRRCYVAGR